VNTISGSYCFQIRQSFRNTGCCCTSCDATHIQNLEIGKAKMNKTFDQFASLLNESPQQFFLEIIFIPVGAMATVIATA
jgi:hypothetical protein